MMIGGTARWARLRWDRPDRGERRELEALARAQKTGQALARRARIVLAAASGLENKAICADVGADANTVSKWRRRFAERRLDGLLDEPRPGAPRTIGDDRIAETVRLTLETRPPGATHWSLRSMADAVGYAPGSVRNSVCGRRVEHQASMALVKRSPKMTANCALAMTHSRGPIFHAFSERFKTR